MGYRRRLRRYRPAAAGAAARFWMQYSRSAVRISSLSSTITGVAMHMSSSANWFVYRILNCGPGSNGKRHAVFVDTKDLPAIAPGTTGEGPAVGDTLLVVNGFAGLGVVGRHETPVQQHVQRVVDHERRWMIRPGLLPPGDMLAGRFLFLRREIARAARPDRRRSGSRPTRHARLVTYSRPKRSNGVGMARIDFPLIFHNSLPVEVVARGPIDARDHQLGPERRFSRRRGSSSSSSRRAGPAR